MPTEEDENRKRGRKSGDMKPASVCFALCPSLPVPCLVGLQAKRFPLSQSPRHAHNRGGEGGRVPGPGLPKKKKSLDPVTWSK